METRQDLLTKEKFVPKRITQKFSEAKNRIAFHNQNAKKERQERAFVEKPLLKNLRILKSSLGEQDMVRLHEAHFDALGYSFDIISGYEKKNGQAIATVFNYSIEPDPSDKNYFIVKKKTNE